MKYCHFELMKNLLNLKIKTSRKHAIRSKSDLWTFDGFQTKPLWKLEMLQKLLLLKVFFTKVMKTHNYFFLWWCFLIIFIRQTLTYDFLGLHKNKNCTFPLNQIVSSTNNLVLSFKKMSLSVRKERLVHEAGHVSWMKNAAC